jgi:hypothetical protein
MHEEQAMVNLYNLGELGHEYGYRRKGVRTVLTKARHISGGKAMPSTVMNTVVPHTLVKRLHSTARLVTPLDFQSMGAAAARVMFEVGVRCLCLYEVALLCHEVPLTRRK